jgi:hypothetical protein
VDPRFCWRRRTDPRSGRTFYKSLLGLAKRWELPALDPHELLMSAAERRRRSPLPASSGVPWWFRPRGPNGSPETPQRNANGLTNASESSIVEELRRQLQRERELVESLKRQLREKDLLVTELELMEAERQAKAVACRIEILEGLAGSPTASVCTQTDCDSVGFLPARIDALLDRGALQ